MTTADLVLRREFPGLSLDQIFDMPFWKGEAYLRALPALLSPGGEREGPEQETPPADVHSANRRAYEEYLAARRG